MLFGKVNATLSVFIKEQLWYYFHFAEFDHCLLSISLISQLQHCCIETFRFISISLLIEQRIFILRVKFL